MRFEIIPVTAFEQNCTLLTCPESSALAIVDPGGEPERLLEAIRALDAAPQMVLLTHGHLDHVGAAPEIARQLGVPIIGPHRADAFWLDALPQQAQLFGFPEQPAFSPDRWLDDGELIRLGRRTLEVLHCPGHTPGHLVFFDRDARLAQVGDVLFRGAIGRTDFPRGDHSALLRSIRDRLFPLGDDVRFIPGHGPTGTFGQERRTNPFVGDPRSH
jgi:glyoxylase-like metal-dependent hydrolase (beta-lactamase superfamily II)